MLARACLLATGLSLLLAVPAAAQDTGRDEPGELPLRESDAEIARGDADSPRLRWGIPEWPSPALEAERRFFGFHLQFEFGGEDRARRPGQRLR